MIAIVDYGLGNLGSITKAFRHLGAEAVLTEDKAVIARADALVLPGDGAFGATMDEIESRGFIPIIRKAAADGCPILGICIGMQVLFEESEEHGLHRGLGLLPGRVRRLEGPLPVPHMGWNQLHLREDEHQLLEGITEGSHVYFVHSYFCDAPSDVVVASTDYGRDIAAIVGRDNVLGMQFHPEKSQAIGLTLVGNFVRFCKMRGRQAVRASVGRSS